MPSSSYIATIVTSTSSIKEHPIHTLWRLSPLKAVESRELRFFNSSPVLDQIAATSDGSSSNSYTTIAKSLERSGGTSSDNNKESSFFSSLFYSATATATKGKDTSTRTNARTRERRSTSSSSSPDDNEQPTIHLTEDEHDLFKLLAVVNHSTNSKKSTLRVAGGWVRDKILASEDFPSISGNAARGERLTSKFKGPSAGRKGGMLIGAYSPRTNPSSLVEVDDTPVDIDVALDDMLGREFADNLNDYLTLNGREKLSVGMVLKNPEKSKHLETATMKVGKFWVDFVNLRAEEYTVGSRIPDMVRIGTAAEDAFRRDLTINALFYNINTGKVEDITGRGFDHLRKGIIATPLPALTTLLDDPLRVLRSVRFAARLRFTMDDDLRNAAQDKRVRVALAQKVARERVGSEVDLMLRSQDPVGAMRLLINLRLVETVFPLNLGEETGEEEADGDKRKDRIYDGGLELLGATHDYLCHCKANPPFWCDTKRTIPAGARYFGVDESALIQDEEARRRLWYAAFLKPLRDHIVRDMRQNDKAKIGRRQGKKAKRSAIMKLLVDDLKRPLRDADTIEAIMKAADDFTNLLDAGCDLSATACILGEVRVSYDDDSGSIICSMGRQVVDSGTEDDPLWCNAMEHRLLVSKVMERVGTLWRAALVLSLSEQLLTLEDDLSYTIEGDVFEETLVEKREGIIQKYDSFVASILQLGLIGIWSQEPLIDGREITVEGVLPNTPRGPVFREIMDEQVRWMTTHPGGKKEHLISHLRKVFPEFV